MRILLALFLCAWTAQAQRTPFSVNGDVVNNPNLTNSATVAYTVNGTNITADALGYPWIWDDGTLYQDAATNSFVSYNLIATNVAHSTAVFRLTINDGNGLFDVLGDGSIATFLDGIPTPIFFVDSPSGYSGAGTKFLSDNGTYQTVASSPNINSLAYGASVTLNLSTNSDQWLVLTGNTTFSTAGVTSNKTALVRIDADASDRTIIFPSGWRYVSGAITNTLLAYKVGLLSVKSYSTTDTNVVAAWSSE